MSDLLLFPEPEKLGAAQCPKCSRFARVIAAGRDSHPDSCDYWCTTSCSKCGVQQA